MLKPDTEHQSVPDKYLVDQKRRGQQRESRIDQRVIELKRPDTRWGSFYLSFWQLISLILVALISVFLYLASARNTRTIDTNFLLSIFGALLSIGTFLPAFLVSFFEKRLATSSVKVFWRGMPKLIMFFYVIFWITTLFLVSSMTIFEQEDIHIQKINQFSLLLSLAFLVLSLIPILLWILFLRLQPKQFGRVTEIFVRKLINQNEKDVGIFIQNYLRSVLGTISQSHNEDLQERLTRISRLATLEDMNIAEKILDGLGWLAQRNIEDREVSRQIIDQIYALTKIPWKDSNNKNRFQRKATQELWSIFEHVLREKASLQILQEIMEVLSALLETSKDEDKSSFLRRFSYAASSNPSMAGFVQRYTFEWLLNNAELLILDCKKNVDIYLDYLLTYDWKNTEKDTRSPDFGLKQAYEDFQKILNKTKKLGKIPNKRLMKIYKIERAIKSSLKSQI